MSTLDISLYCGTIFAMKATEQVHIRCTRQEKKAWTKVAKADGRSLTSLVRKLLNEATGR